MIDGRIFELCKQLSDNLKHDWTVEEMAARYDLTVPHLQKLFKREMGKTPNSYFRDLRLERVAYLLTNTFEPIKQIGVQTGLTNDSHLTRDFKKKYGMTPTEYRRHYWNLEQSLPPDGQE